MWYLDYGHKKNLCQFNAKIIFVYKAQQHNCPLIYLQLTSTVCDMYFPYCTVHQQVTQYTSTSLEKLKGSLLQEGVLLKLLYCPQKRDWGVGDSHCFVIYYSIGCKKSKPHEASATNSKVFLICKWDHSYVCIQIFILWWLYLHTMWPKAQWHIGNWPLTNHVVLLTPAELTV